MTVVAGRLPVAGGEEATGGSRWLCLAGRLGRELESTAVERERTNVPPTEALSQLRETGLVNLLVREDLGGEGGTLTDAVRVVAELSRGDANVGALLAFHYYVSFVPRLFDFEGDAESFQRRSAAGRWVWANVHQPREGKFVARPTADGGFVINGSKRWATGGPLADVTDVVAQRTDRRELLFAVVPTDREGLSWADDWDHLGLRLTATVSVDFVDVVVHPDEVIPSTHGEPQDRFPPLYTAFVLPLYSAVFIGAARRALEQARDHILAAEHPASGGLPPSGDPVVHQRLGYHLARLDVAEEFTHHVAERVWTGWTGRHQLSGDAKGELAVLASAARRQAVDVALAATSDVYELTGAEAAVSSSGLDRHWRDVRTLSLHDSLSLSQAAIGDFYLNGTLPGFPSMAI